MKSLYEELVTVHKAVFRLHNMHQKYKYNAKYIKVVHTTIIVVHEWSMQYKGALSLLGTKTRQQAELEKSQVWMIIQSNKQLASFIANVQASYARLYNNVDFMEKSHKSPLVGSLTEVRCRNQVRQEVEEYLDQLRKSATKEDLEVNKSNMQKRIGGPVKINMMLLLLKKEIQAWSKSISWMQWRPKSISNLIPSHNLGKSSHSTKIGITM